MPRLNNSVYRIWIFMVGVIATIAYRIVIILNHYSQFWVEVAWYIGTIGFICSCHAARRSRFSGVSCSCARSDFFLAASPAAGAAATDAEY